MMKKLIYIIVAIFCTQVYSQIKDSIIIVNNKEINIEYDLMWTKKELNTRITEIRDELNNSNRTSQGLINILNTIPLSNDACVNGGFENGSLGWTGLSLRHPYYYPGITPIEDGLSLNPGIQPISNINGSGYGQNFINLETSGIDNILATTTPSFNMQRVISGSNSIRLGNNERGRGAEGIAKRFIVTPVNAKYFFQYAVIMDESHSGPVGDPRRGSEVFFIAHAVDLAGNTIDKVTEVGNPSNPFINAVQGRWTATQNQDGTIYYRNWRCAYLDLSSMIGQQVVVMFINSDCNAGGHRGYTYIDDSCKTCSNLNEGDIKIDLSSDNCLNFPQTINGTFSMPSNKPVLNESISLEIYQNNVIVNTITNSIISGNNYSFNLNASDFPNQAMDQCYDLVSVLSFQITDLNGNLQTIKQVSSKVVNGIQDGEVTGLDNDVCFCGPNFDCCQTDLEIYGEQDPFSVQNTFINSTNLSYAEETFTLHQDATIPIKELRVSVTDIQFNYNYDQCATCVNNPALWGGIYSSDEHIGTLPNAVSQSNFNMLQSLGYDVDNGNNTREIIWQNSNGAMLKAGDKFKVTYLLPPTSEIPCCATSVRICTKLSWQDANCNICERFTCSNIDLVEKITSLKLSQKKNDCCSTTLIATTDVPASYNWSTGETTEQITVTQNGTYTVTATTGSSSLTKTIIVSNIPTGSFPTLSYPPQARPDQGVNFVIRDYTKGYSDPNSYNATKYTLWIFNRWNTDRFQGAFRKITGYANCENGFNNGDIQWDGRDDNGNKVQSGLYPFILRLENCDNKCASENSICNEQHSYERFHYGTTGCGSPNSNDVREYDCVSCERKWQFPIPWPIKVCKDGWGISPQRIGVIDLQW